MSAEYSLHEIEAIRNAHLREPVKVRQIKPLVRHTPEELERSLLAEAPAIVAAALKSGKITKRLPLNTNLQTPNFKIAALLLLLSAFCFPVFSMSFLDAVAMVESSHNHKAIGDGGRAVGLYQFHRDAWEVARRTDPSVGEYDNATDPARSRLAAAAYFSWLGKQFRRHGIASPSHAQLYAAYNRGFTGFRTRYKFDVSLTPKTTRRACERIESLTR